MPQYCLTLNSCALVFFFCYSLLCPTCSLVYTVSCPINFGGNFCESIALILPPFLPPSLCLSLPPPSLPSLLYFFTVDSSSNFDSEKESLGEDVDEEEEEDEVEEEEEMGSDLEGMAPTPKRSRLANASALMVSLQSGLYPEFLGVHSPSQDLNPNDNSALDYLSLLWPASLCDLIAGEMDRYA